MSKRKAFVNFVKADGMLFLFAVTVLAMLLRLRFFRYESSDYHQFLQGWFSLIRENGGFGAIGMDFGDYTPPYYYLLALVSYLPFRDLYLIKILSCMGDILLAAFAFLIVDLKYGEFWGEISYGVVLFLPSVLINSAIWAQCDCMYTAALAACVYFLMTDRQYRALAAYGIAFVLKLQSVFLAPFLLVLLLKRKIRLRSILMVPLVYVAAVFPAVLMGRNFWDLLTVYFRQAKEYSTLTMNLPNLFTWFPQQESELIGTAAVLGTGILVLFTMIYLCAHRFHVTNELLISLALFYALLLPYFLPYMHERYYYPADIFSVAFAFYFPEKFYVPVLTVLASTYSTCRFLFGLNFISMKLFSVLMLFCLIWVGIHIRTLIRGDTDGKQGCRLWAK